ncbi:MAG: S8/S53 family peptidase, partial [Ornithinimicrobium sp.]
EYAVPGSGGRGPAALSLPDPAQTSGRVKRAPVVVVLDTGLGAHPWFADPTAATDQVEVNGVLLGLAGPMNTMPPALHNPLDGGLLPYAGHGTFIAGLVRQQCPQARILGVPIMGGDGVVGEGLLMRTLVALLIRQAVAVQAGDRDSMIDVLSLSLGYYHEEPADASIDPMLRGLLKAFGSWGVAVVTAAGNDATIAPFHPAAFAAQVTGFDPHVVPLVSVGALNPNGTAVAYFSNAGPWVSCHRLGANVISTLPTDLNGDRQPSVRMRYHKTERATIDPDDFSGGFGTWSGTSFAAPVLAGQLARRLAQDPAPSSIARTEAVERGWKAVAQELPGWSP